MSNFCIELIDHQAGMMDLQFDYDCSLNYLSQSNSFALKIEERSDRDEVSDISFFNLNFDPVQSFSQSTQKSSKESLKPKPSMLKTKTIMKDKSKTTEERQDSERISQKYQRRRGENKNTGYPTKNFLPNFKTCHLEYLEKHVKKEILSRCELVRLIKQKDGISMADYECLYNIPQFYDAFNKMFRSKILYRDLLLSRSTLKSKLIHQEKIYVFEKAFRTKNFKKINN